MIEVVGSDGTNGALGADGSEEHAESKKPSFALPISATEISLMTYNVENLFDTKDDMGKDDKAFLPASFKKNAYHKGHCRGIEVKKWRDECLYLDWSEVAKTKKILNIAKVVSSYDFDG